SLARVRRARDGMSWLCSLVGTALQELLVCIVEKSERGRRGPYLPLSRNCVTEHLRLPARRVAIGRPRGQVRTVWIAAAREVDPVRRHDFGEPPIDVGPRHRRREVVE